MTNPIVGQLRGEATDRLATIINLPTPDERRAQAEWIVDAIVRAAVVDTTQRMIDANKGPCARPPGAIHQEICDGCGYSRFEHARTWA